MNFNQKISYIAPYVLEKANGTDVGYDLVYTGTEPVEFKFGDRKLLETGVRIKVEGRRPFYSIFMRKLSSFLSNDQEVIANPFGFDAQVRGRSSMAVKGFMTHVGTIDETYQSEIKALLFYLDPLPYTIKPGDKIAQLVISTFVPCEFVKVEEMEENRGGFGSSGR